jgi:N-acetyl sugar amidotransferase
VAHLEQPQPPFDGLRYCTRCCMPETQEGIKFDEMGICQACQSSEQKIHIDWTVRERELRRILDEAKAKAGNNYDCIVPISGGKDSTFQLHVLTKVYGMRPLAVTFSHNWFSDTGWYNLQNALEQFNVDHMMFTPNRSLVNRLARTSLAMIGDACWHCHAGVGAFPLQVAAKFKIPLLIWGESIAESSGRASYDAPVRKFDREYFTKVSAKRFPKEMVTADISERDVAPFEVPSVEEIEAVGVFGIHLGDYIFWDDERQTEFVRDTYGWRETEVEGTYKRYKSAECIMPGVHDFTNYLKRGYGRATFHASMDVRNGLLTREEGFDLAKQHDAMRPEALDYFLEITGMSEEEFYETMRRHRLAQLGEIELPVKPKDHANEERILPFPQQVIEKQRRDDQSR